MKGTTLIFAATVLGSVLYSGTASAQRSRNLDEVVLTVRRPMKDIGVQKTVFDSLSLKENLALSMADVLAYNSSVFVKNYGRATLSTVSFRGTSPSHTQVTWNGMRINSPMLGMTDFSTIPSFFIDRASLLHGTSSVTEAGGGLGGLVSLSSGAAYPQGVGLQYVQGVGSFSTFDEFARFSYAGNNWSAVTRVAYASSPNDYKYVNHDKMINIYDDLHNIIGRYHPTERNRSGSYKDLNILQEVRYDTHHGDKFGLYAWFTNSNRELPMLTTDYGSEKDFENRQRENSFRGVLTWDRLRSKWKAGAKAGYIHTHMAYDYKKEVADDNWVVMTRSRSRVNTFFARLDGEYSPVRNWYFTANVSAHQHLVRSEDKNIILQDGDKAIVGYDQGRLELSAAASAKWQPTDRLGMSVILREELAGSTWAPVIPAFFIDGLLSRRANVMVKASVSRNYRFPSLNDLYFLPGGNPDLKSERGITYDAGLSFDKAFGNKFSIGGGATWFDSRIDDWILWLPTTKGFFSPRNVKKVHSYGVEAKLNVGMHPFRDWYFDFNGSYSWTPSVNRGENMSQADQSVGKQLPYVPKHSASFNARVSWRTWSLLYKWCFYSERYTMSSNDLTLSGTLPKYYMNNVAVEKALIFKPADVSLKLAVNNLFNEDYLSVLSRPMPGINFEFFITVTPKFFTKK
ncbi:MAG: TonB-dependent receptor [Muribaculaceae bacterium]|nr:TonB-dependent receptor [Muribaculaceae bacterium]